MLGELLTQLDGVEDNDGVYVIGSTNNKQILDIALSTRPGRFDLILEFSLPQTEQRKQLVEMYSFGIDETMRNCVVEKTDGFTPAQVKEVLIKSKIYETSTGKKVTEDELNKIVSYTKNTYLGTKLETYK